MKRARVLITDFFGPSRARSRVSPGSPEALLALLQASDVTVGQLLADAAAVASFTDGMVARTDDSEQRSSRALVASRAALASTTRRVCYCAKRRVRLSAKNSDAATELACVTAKQLYVWGSPAMPQRFLVECGAVVCALVAVRPFLASPDVLAECTRVVEHVLQVRDAAQVVTGDGLRVIWAAGPGLKWFLLHSRNEFSVALAQANGSVLDWIKMEDIDVVLGFGTGPTAGWSIAPSMLQHLVAQDGIVNVVYRYLSWGYDDFPEAIYFRLSVCGVFMSETVVDGEDWCVGVLRRPLPDQHCGSFAVVEGIKYGMAVSADEKWLVVLLESDSMLFVYSLPEGELVRSFGCYGNGPLEFVDPCRLCFAPNGNVIVTDWGNYRLQEVTLEGGFVRFIGEGEFDRCVSGVAVHNDVIAVARFGGTGPRVVLFDDSFGTVILRFGEVGAAPGQLSVFCCSIRFTLDGCHLIVAEYQAKRLSLFTTAGVFVRCVDADVISEGWNDVLQSVTGEIIVVHDENHRVCVFSPDCSKFVRSWGEEGTAEGQFSSPVALAEVGQHLYVMDKDHGRVQVFK